MKYCTLAEKKCVWVSTPSPKALQNPLRRNAMRFFQSVSQDFCGICGCNLWAKKTLGGQCPLITGENDDDSKTELLETENVA